MIRFKIGLPHTTQGEIVQHSQSSQALTIRQTMRIIEMPPSGEG